MRFVNGINAFIKEASRAAFPLAPCEDTAQGTTMSQKAGSPQTLSHLELRLQVFRALGNSYLLFMSFPDCGALL
jgi:hypothetical protein